MSAQSEERMSQPLIGSSDMVQRRENYRIDSLEVLLIKKIYDAQEKYNR